MNKPAHVLSESDVLAAEIRRRAEELERLERRLRRLRGDPPELRPVAAPTPPEPGALRREDPVVPLAEVERRYILAALGRFGGNRTHTARALGIGTNTLWRKLKAWGEPPARR